MKIDNRRETLEISKDQALISSLQELISQRRELRVVEINRIHFLHMGFDIKHRNFLSQIPYC